MRIHLVPMPVALRDSARPVDGGDVAVGAEHGFIGAQAHGAAEIALGVAALLEAFGAHPFGDQADHGLLRLAEFGAARAFEPGGVPRRLDAGHLHAQANAEEGDASLAGEADRGDLAFRAALAEAAGDEDAVDRLEHRRDVRRAAVEIGGEQLRVEPVDADLDAVGEAAVDQSLGQRLVGVLQADIFADHADRHLALKMLLPVHDVLPAGEVRLGRVLDAEGAQHLGVEPLAMILERHRIDALGIQSGDDRFFAHVAELRDLGALAVGQRAVDAAQEQVRLDAEAGEIADAVLCGLGLQLARSGDIGDEGGVDRDGALGPRILVPEVVPQLPDRLDEGQRFDVADGAADLANEEIEAVRIGAGEGLDLVGDVGDDLDGGAEIVAAPLLHDDVAIDAAGGDIVRLAGGNAGEALVMAEVEIGLGAVVGDVDFPVLVGAHRAGIDVEIGIELADADLVAARLEQGGEARRHQALAKR